MAGGRAVTVGTAEGIKEGLSEGIMDAPSVLGAKTGIMEPGGGASVLFVAFSGLLEGDELTSTRDTI
jgi:hypothetical protein